MSVTTRIDPRDLNADQKKRIKGMLKHGDVGKITVRCSVGYKRVSEILRNGEDHPEVWKETIDYLDNLPKVEVSSRLAKVISMEAA